LTLVRLAAPILASLAVLAGTGLVLALSLDSGTRRRALESASEAKPSFAAVLRELDLVPPPGGKTAEDFTVPRLGGGAFRLSDQRGRTVLVNFWATWCPPCLAEMPAMERLWRERQHEGFVIVAVSLDADPAIVPAFIEERGVTFPVGLDPTMAVASTYGVRALPATFVIDRRSRVVALALGPRAWDARAFHSLVDALGR
jgi:peroxiredoxin